MLRSAFGLFALMALCWLFSEKRSSVRLRLVAAALCLQLGLALLLLKLPGSQDFFLALNSLALALEEATRAGTSLVFGYLGGGDLPFDETSPGAAYILAFRGLPIVLVVSALSALLFHWRIIPPIVRGFSLLLQKTLGIGGTLGVGAATNIFVGMIEAPLFIRPYLNQLTRSELFALMTCGMATIAGTMLVLYSVILQPVVQGALGQILTASIISAPAALLTAQLLVPETEEVTTGKVAPPDDYAGSMDAVTKGTARGVTLLLNITAMLVVLVALVALINQLLEFLPDVYDAPLTLQRTLGWAMAPVVWLIGIPWAEAPVAGALMGTKTVLNEFLAYLDMAHLPEGALSERSRMIMTYAMCGFANFGSLGIMIGGMGAMAPERRPEIVSLGLKSVLSGTVATLMTGAVVGIMY